MDMLASLSRPQPGSGWGWAESPAGGSGRSSVRSQQHSEGPIQQAQTRAPLWKPQTAGMPRSAMYSRSNVPGAGHRTTGGTRQHGPVPGMDASSSSAAYRARRAQQRIAGRTIGPTASGPGAGGPVRGSAGVPWRQSRGPSRGSSRRASGTTTPTMSGQDSPGVVGTPRSVPSQGGRAQGRRGRPIPAAWRQALESKARTRLPAPLFATRSKALPPATRKQMMHAGRLAGAGAGAEVKPPLRAVFHEPTATAGLIAPGRRTEYTR